MDSRFQNFALGVSERLRDLETEYWATARNAFLLLEQYDPEIFRFAVDLMGDREAAARWFGERTAILYGKTPWGCLAANHIQDVRQALRAMMLGTAR